MTRLKKVKRRTASCRLGTLAAAVVALTGARAAYCQARPTATGPGPSIVVGATFSRFEADYGKAAISGAAIYVDSNAYWRYGIETEARSILYPSFGERQSTLLAGPRWALRTNGIVPYVKVLAGGGRFDFPYGYGHGDYFVVSPGAGVDLRLGERLRIRLVDCEYQVWTAFSFGGLHPYGVSTGLSYQLVGGSREYRRKWGR